MKVAYVYRPPWDPHISAGLGIWNSYVTRLIAQKCDVIVYTGTLPGRSNIECVEGVRYRRFSLGFDHWLLRYLEALWRRSLFRTPVFASSLYYVGFALQVAIDLRMRRCDIVHIHDLSQFVPIVRAVNPKIRIVLHMHGEWLTQISRKIIKPRIDKADLIIACSEYVATRIRTSFPAHAKRTHTVFMGVDPELFAPNTSQPRIDSFGRKRLLYVGRISPEKGVHVLVEAFQKVRAVYPETELEIVGPGWVMPVEYLHALTDDTRVAALKVFYKRDYRSFIEAQLRSGSLCNVRLRGLVLHPALADCYRDADVFILPSFYESFGTSAAEAMASKLPVVASRAGALPEVIEDNKTGILVQPGNADQLAEGILQLLGNEELRVSLGAAGRERATRLYSWKSVSTRLFSLYNELFVGHERR